MKRTSKANLTNVNDYIAAQPKPTRLALAQVRRAIRKALPKAEEVISYKMPACKLNGSIVVYFAGWKNHYSLYPAGERLVAAFKDELGPYKSQSSDYLNWCLANSSGVYLQAFT
jgi:uncharacterized protein YdhG (YjbR/CyaY superfamily)